MLWKCETKEWRQRQKKKKKKCSCRKNERRKRRTIETCFRASVKNDRRVPQSIETLIGIRIETEIWYRYNPSVSNYMHVYWFWAEVGEPRENTCRHWKLQTEKSQAFWFAVRRLLNLCVTGSLVWQYFGSYFGTLLCSGMECSETHSVTGGTELVPNRLCEHCGGFCC